MIRRVATLDSRLSRAEGLKRVPRVAFPSRNYGEIPPSVSFPLARATRAHLFKESAEAANPRERKRERGGEGWLERRVVFRGKIVECHASNARQTSGTFLHS